MTRFFKFISMLFLGSALVTGCSGSGDSGAGSESSKAPVSGGGGDSGGGGVAPDTTAPTVSITKVDSSDTSNSFAVSITFSEIVTGLEVSDFQVDAGLSVSNLSGSGQNYTATLSISASGPLKISLAAGAVSDGAGNVNLVSQDFSFSYTALAFDATLSNLPDSLTKVTSLNVSVAGTDVVTYQYKLGLSGSTDCSVASGYSSDISQSTAITESVSGLADGLIKLCVVGKDSGGTSQDYTSATVYTWTKDTQAPTVTGLSNGSGYVASAVWSWSCSETCTFDYLIDTSAATDPSGSYAATTTANQTIGQGRYYIHVQAKDGADNESAVVHVYADVDAVGPTTPGSVTDGAFSNSLTTGTTFTWTASTDSGSGLDHYEYAIGTSAGATNTKTWTSVGASTTVQATGLSLVNGTTYYATVRAVDSVGNVSTAANGDGWVIDTVAPTAVSSLDDTATNGSLSQSPTLTWMAATDASSGIAYYQLAIGTTSGATDVLAWSSISNVTTYQKTGLSLSSSSTYYASVRAVDNAGNTGAAVTSAGWSPPADPCMGSPSLGTSCAGGAIYLGSLSPGATTGSGTDKYMTTPGGCGDIPGVSVSGGSGPTSYAENDFTVTCSGTDNLTKTWNNGTLTWYNIPGLTNYSGTIGTGKGAINTDEKYGSANAAIIVAITDGAQAGYHAAARYCDKLSYGGHTDWYLPNRYELNLFYTNKASIPGLSTSGPYLSSTESGSSYAWMQLLSDGYQYGNNKNNATLVRCVRKF